MHRKRLGLWHSKWRTAEHDRHKHRKEFEREGDMIFRDVDYPGVDEILIAVDEFVRRKLRGEWPEDEWFSVGSNWSVNVWKENGCRRITVYRDMVTASGYVETDCSAGISIPISS